MPDRNYIMVIFKDGDATFVNDVQQVVRSGTARNPTNCYRKSQRNGMAQMEWTGSDFCPPDNAHRLAGKFGRIRSQSGLTHLLEYGCDNLRSLSSKQSQQR